MALPCLAAALIALAVMAIWLRRTARQSGVSRADLARVLPGDALVAEPELVMDRAAVLEAPPERVWPWIAQLGKGRAGWYCPRWLERFTGKTELSGIRHIDERYQHLQPGEDTPDWGPGDPVFRVVEIAPPGRLVYLSMRDPAANWTWPAQTDPPPDGTLILSWALVLEPLDEKRSRLFIRLRVKRQGRPVQWWFFWFGGLIDWLTIVLLSAGLRERVSG